MNRQQRHETIPRGVWALGFVSLFMDISSEMIHGLLPVFLVSVLGASALTVGIIEGIGESLALIVRLFSGVLSDYLKSRKPLVLAGYLLGTLSKPLFALASSAAIVLTARSLDRIGKGIRGAPRDALIADLAPHSIRGAAYGLRQSLDSIGAVVGPLLAVMIMWLSNDNFRAVFWLAAVPGFISVAIILWFVKEPQQVHSIAKTPFQIKDIRKLSPAFWLVLTVGMVFTLSRFSEAFLLLRAEELGVQAHFVPAILIIMSLTFALGAYPVGVLSDHWGRSGLLLLGLGVLVITHLVLAFSTSVFHATIGAALWGLHLALTQGLFAAFVADSCTENLRGSAFGIFSFATGIAILLASVIAGLLWDISGSKMTFLTGAGFALAALLGSALLLKRFRQPAG
ncbi:MAG: MFS transporter [Gammaproteobacteria bacterium]|nr:MFS transporter [Gammaproteobacteria bacterium]